MPRRKGQELVKETRLKQQILRFTTAGQFLDGALVLSSARARRKRNIISSLEHFVWRGCKPTKYQDFMVRHDSDSDLLPGTPHCLKSMMCILRPTFIHILHIYSISSYG